MAHSVRRWDENTCMREHGLSVHGEKRGSEMGRATFFMDRMNQEEVEGAFPREA